MNEKRSNFNNGLATSPPPYWRRDAFKSELVIASAALRRAPPPAIVEQSEQKFNSLPNLNEPTTHDTAAVGQGKLQELNSIAVQQY